MISGAYCVGAGILRDAQRIVGLIQLQRRVFIARDRVGDRAANPLSPRTCRAAAGNSWRSPSPARRRLVGRISFCSTTTSLGSVDREVGLSGNDHAETIAARSSRGCCSSCPRAAPRPGSARGHRARSPTAHRSDTPGQIHSPGSDRRNCASIVMPPRSLVTLASPCAPAQKRRALEADVRRAAAMQVVHAVEIPLHHLDPVDIDPVLFCNRVCNRLQLRPPAATSDSAPARLRWRERASQATRKGRGNSHRWQCAQSRDCRKCC